MAPKRARAAKAAAQETPEVATPAEGTADDSPATAGTSAASADPVAKAGRPAKKPKLKAKAKAAAEAQAQGGPSEADAALLNGGAAAHASLPAKKRGRPPKAKACAAEDSAPAPESAGDSGVSPAPRPAAKRRKADASASPQAAVAGADADGGGAPPVPDPEPTEPLRAGVPASGADEASATASAEPAAPTVPTTASPAQDAASAEGTSAATVPAPTAPQCSRCLSPAASAGQAVDRTLVLELPPCIEGQEVVEFLSVAIFTTLNLFDEEPIGLVTCERTADGLAELHFCSSVAASVALRLNGLSLRDGVLLSVRRPAAFVAAHPGADPSASLVFENVSAEQLFGQEPSDLGMPAPAVPSPVAASEASAPQAAVPSSASAPASVEEEAAPPPAETTPPAAEAARPPVAVEQAPADTAEPSATEPPSVGTSGAADGPPPVEAAPLLSAGAEVPSVDAPAPTATAAETPQVVTQDAPPPAAEVPGSATILETTTPAAGAASSVPPAAGTPPVRMETRPAAERPQATGEPAAPLAAEAAPLVTETAASSSATDASAPPAAGTSTPPVQTPLAPETVAPVVHAAAPSATVPPCPPPEAAAQPAVETAMPSTEAAASPPAPFVEASPPTVGASAPVATEAPRPQAADVSPPSSEGTTPQVAAPDAGAPMDSAMEVSQVEAQLPAADKAAPKSAEAAETAEVPPTSEAASTAPEPAAQESAEATRTEQAPPTSEAASTAPEVQESAETTKSAQAAPTSEDASTAPEPAGQGSAEATPERPPGDVGTPKTPQATGPTPPPRNQTRDPSPEKPPGDHSAPRRLPPEEQNVSHYKALGIERASTPAEVKKAYYMKSRLYHPDKNHDDPLAVPRFQRVSEAYQILSDPQKRTHYDATLVLQAACANLGVRDDRNGTLFVERHSVARGIEVHGMQIEARYTAVIIGSLNQMKQQSGADILLLTKHMRPHAEILLAGTRASVDRARQIIDVTIGEYTGIKAPADGVVMIVPQSVHHRMQYLAAHFNNLLVSYSVHTRLASESRIVIRPHNLAGQVTRAIAWIQGTLEWKSSVLLHGGQIMDAWSYAHFCETAWTGQRNVETFAFLLPPTEPDAATARRILCLALGANEEAERTSTLVELSTRALNKHYSGTPVTGALIRAATCVAVHAEHASLPVDAGAPLLVALHSVVPVAASVMSARFSNAPLFKTLTALSTSLLDVRDGMVIRMKGFRAVKETIPDDNTWQKWHTLLVPGGPLAAFWDELRTFVDERRLGVSIPPKEWFQVPVLMSSILRACVAHPVECDAKFGLRRGQEPRPPPGAPGQAAQAPASTNGRGPPPPPPGSPPGVPAAPAAASPAAQAAVAAASPAVPSVAPTTSADGEPLTLVEQVEEVLWGLMGSDPAAFVLLGTATQEADKLIQRKSSERLSKRWYETYTGSFELKKVHEEWRVRLTDAARQRVAAVIQERLGEAKRKKEREFLGGMLPRLSADQLPRTLRTLEYAALLCELSKGSSSGKGQGSMATGLLNKLCIRGTAVMSPKDFLSECRPFSPAQIMQAIVALEKKKKELWKREELNLVIAAAALDFASEDRAEREMCSLSNAAMALWAAARRPFEERIAEARGRGFLIAAGFRLQLELHVKHVLSPAYSTFKPFAQMCAWMAHSVVTVDLEPQVREESMATFKLLATACEELGQAPENAPCDPEGLCRLAMTLSLVVRKEKDRKSIGLGALQGLARVALRALDESSEWTLGQLEVVARAYATVDVPQEGLFRKISAVAERHVTAGREMSSEHLLKLLNSFWSLGQARALERLLRALEANRTLDKFVKGASPKDVPMLFNVLVMVNSHSVLEDLAKQQRDKLHGMSLGSMVSVLKEMKAVRVDGSQALQQFKAAAIVEAVNSACKKAPSLSDVKFLVEAAKGDSKASQHFKKLAAAPPLVGLLSNLPTADNPWLDLAGSMSKMLKPFRDASVEVPRFEGVCAAKLLVALEKAGSSTSIAPKFAPAALCLPDTVYVAMPSLLEAVASRLEGSRLHRASPSAPELKEVRELCELIVSAAKKVGTKRATSSSSTGDAELDGWVEKCESCILEDPSRRSERHMESLLDLVVKRHPEVAKDAKEALGQQWFSSLVLRSRKIQWSGGKMAALHAPRPRLAAKTMANAASGFLPKDVAREASALETELDRERAREKERLEKERQERAERERAEREKRERREAERQERDREKQARQRAAEHAAERVEMERRERSRETSKPAGAARFPPGQAPASKAGPSAPCGPPPGGLIINAGDDAELGKTLAGRFVTHSHNHGKPVFRRVDPPCTDQEVVLYYWDGRDGEAQMGWWFGTMVGGEEVWCHNPELGTPATQPPLKGWVAMHNGEIDEALEVLSEAPKPVGGPPPSGPGRPGPSQVRPSGGPPPRGSVGASMSSAAPMPSAPSRPPSAYRPAPAAPSRPSGAYTPRPYSPAAGPRPPGGPPPGFPPGGPAGPRRPSSAAPSSFRPAAAPAGARRPFSDMAKPVVGGSELDQWLLSLDEGAGAMLQYKDILQQEFDGDLEMIKAVKVEGATSGGAMGMVDPSFWETVRVAKTGHKMCFARGIARL